MPGLDSTGPSGQGPRTGRGLGPCGSGMGWGYGMGRGRFIGCCPQPYYTPSKEEEKQALEQELKAVQERLKELEK